MSKSYYRNSRAYYRNHAHEGDIPGLRLPRYAWEMLHEQGITTLDQLRAVADRLHKLPGIGTKTAQLIREELARATPPEAPPSDKE
ncbi:hypothetical protein AA309_10620 [Microvirga vignae]|uniref:RNA polymerase alpha subunit C-terminal domain-containing protein n=1 Tax=Microvirga vignae TaxID=1225564 RepID=A0A0H1RK91_9HYPH|nr:helix-hairpin-helix domain-containing protein [Microvirga vignae]KLK93027.1 hypothetical protein AA309_10620 [Microvirga vignae]